MRNAPRMLMFHASATEIRLFPRRDASRSVVFSRFPLGVLSSQPIWGSHLLLPLRPSRVCCHPASPLCCVFIEKSVRACLECILSPIRRQLAQQIDAAVGFLAICKSAVTVMGAAQRCWRCGKCQHVRKE